MLTFIGHSQELDAKIEDIIEKGMGRILKG